MGIDIYVFDFLMGLPQEEIGDVLCLGRQGFHIAKHPEHLEIAQELLSARDSGRKVAELIAADGFSETFLRYLGARTVRSMDMSTFEGAEITHDLNTPVPPDLHGKFDFILDGGTLEHVYDVPMAISNVKLMLRRGGRFVSINAANNQLGHGLYQFSPELFWRAFSVDSGFRISSMALVPAYGRPTRIDVTETIGIRQEVGRTDGPTYLMVCARREAKQLNLKSPVHQSDYAAAWERNKESLGAPAKKTNRVVTLPKRRNALHKLWVDQSAATIHAIDASSELHHFMQKVYNYYDCEDMQLSEFVKKHQKNFERSLINASRNPQSTNEIPLITHRMWLTAPTAPSYPPENYIADYLDSLKALPSCATHYFWTNSAKVADWVKQRADSSLALNLLVADVQMLSDQAPYDDLLKLIDARKFVLAADVAKFMILNRFGGVYSDLGIVFSNDILDLILTADYAFLHGGGGFFQTSFIASSPGDRLISLFLATICHPGALSPAYSLMGSSVQALDEVHLFAGPAFTALIMLFVPDHMRVLTLTPQTGHLIWRSEQSWYGNEAKHGNVLVTGTSATVISAARIAEVEARLGDRVQGYRTSKILLERLRILIATLPYFEANPTQACKIFYFHGSDKACSWHNYGFLYDFILWGLNRPVQAVLEVGIGTNYLDIPSTMGATGVPGASLRAWKELFPAARVVGADVDRRILFQGDGIETFFVDQTAPSTIRAMFDGLSGQRFDLIVDDGLHEFDANRNLLEIAYPFVSSGLYVVEDVLNNDVPLWVDFLQSSDYSGVIVELPSAVNHNDNRLVMILGRTQ